MEIGDEKVAIVTVGILEINEILESAKIIPYMEAAAWLYS
jgi:hypothetical protein